MRAIPLNIHAVSAPPFVAYGLDDSMSLVKRFARRLFMPAKAPCQPLGGSAISETILDSLIRLTLEADAEDPDPFLRPPVMADLVKVFKGVKGEPLDLFSVAVLLSLNGRMDPLEVLKGLMNEALQEDGPLARAPEGCFMLKRGGRHAGRRPT